MASKAWREANREALKEYNAAWRTSHKEHLRDYHARRYAEDPERMREFGRQSKARHADRVRAAEHLRYYANRESELARNAMYCAAHREQVRARTNEWRRQHRDRVQDWNARSRVKRVGAPTCTHASCLVLGPVALAWQVNEHACYICGEPLVLGPGAHLDHVIPLSRGGVHCAENLRPSCPPCNLRKGTRVPEEVAAGGSL